MTGLVIFCTFIFIFGIVVLFVFATKVPTEDPYDRYDYYDSFANEPSPIKAGDYYVPQSGWTTTTTTYFKPKPFYHAARPARRWK